ETFISRLDASMCDDQGYPLLIVGNRLDILSYVLKRDFPILILTGMQDEDCSALDLEGFKGWIYISEADTAETIRLLRISIPALAIANRDLPVLGPKVPLKQIKKVLLNLNHHGIAVVENQKLLGLITGSMLIDPPRHRVIMVDHNEVSQSVEGIDLADIVEIIDHHRLNTIRSNQPIYVYADPLGSSCTLVYKLFRSAGVIPPKEIAALLLSGILSDTVILRSPTTTEEDISAARALGALAGLEPDEWGKKIFQNAASLSALDPDLAVGMDFKVYSEEDCRLGIAQIEVVTLRDLAEVKAAFLEALERMKAKQSLDWAMLLITDIIEQESILLSTPYALAEEMIYKRLDSQTFLLPGILSRKKQLLPEILYVLKHR
ncbi:MAG TPA: DHH family phosphoesterase, partial [Candidatus Cloacimonadota bacterium]|nr:DHH family phosphoesterase [Candidatus Cloacimonadota bacterium]